MSFRGPLFFFGLSGPVTPVVVPPIIDENTLAGVTNLSTLVEELNNRLKLMQSDLDSIKKRSKYWEDRNLIRQTVDEKVGRSSFRNRRQEIGGTE